MDNQEFHHAIGRIETRLEEIKDDLNNGRDRMNQLDERLRSIPDHTDRLKTIEQHNENQDLDIRELTKIIMNLPKEIERQNHNHKNYLVQLAIGIATSASAAYLIVNALK